MFGLETKVLWLFVFAALYWSYCIYWGIKGARQSKQPEIILSLEGQYQFGFSF